MLLIKESVVVHEARTGVEFTPAKKTKVIPIPRRFYCHWKLPIDEIQYDENGKEIIDDYTNGKCCFNHRVGLPTRKWETDVGTVEVIRVELNHPNRRMITNYFRHRKLSKNKCRGDGTTEIITVRWNVFKYGVMNTIPNRKCIIMPGTSSKLTNEISTRIKALCDKIPQIYKFGIPSAIAPLKFFFESGGRIELTSATPDADRGYENVGDINQEEVAHWELINDRPVYYASEGVFDKTRCHITHNTTPRGKRGFYYELVWSPEATSDFYKQIVNWREIVGLPVVKIEDLYNIGHIDDNKLQELRQKLLHQYNTDPEYKNWYETFTKSNVLVFWDNGVLIPFEEIIDIPTPLLDINAIVLGSKTDRSHYDQEHDNEFIAGQSRAFGNFVDVDMQAIDLDEQITNFKNDMETPDTDFTYEEAD